jgi:hypothetical protein
MVELDLQFVEINDADTKFSTDYSGCVGIKSYASLTTDEAKKMNFLYNLKH